MTIPQIPHIGPQRYALGRSGWVVAGLAAVRVVVPLLVLAGVGVPGAPAFEYIGLTGDATGFYAAARELVAAWRRLPVGLLVVVLVAAGAATVALVVAWRRGERRGWVVAGVAALAAALACTAISQMHAAGAAVVGWPLVWAVPLLPFRVASASLDQDGAYVAAVALSLAANVATVVATAYGALFATASRTVALVASGLFALWPLWIGPLAGERASENGTWAVDAGLAGYTEPLSTALVSVALALLLSPVRSDAGLALAGALLGFATTVKLSNGLLALIALALVVRRVGPVRAAPFAAAGAAFVPVVVLYWPKGYSAILEEDPDAWPDDAFALGHAAANWEDSLLFTPLVVAFVVPLAIVGAVAVRDAWQRWTLVAWAGLNPLVYSFYWVTALHPRMLFAGLPATFVLWACGLAAIGRSRAPTRLRT